MSRPPPGGFFAHIFRKGGFSINLFEVFATIGLKDDGFNKGIDGALGKGKDFATKIGGAISTGVDKINSIGEATLKGIATVGGAVGTLVGASVNAYASYEQLVGGVETLFGKSADMVMQYAENAYKTAGMSANAYMETVTNFSASLLQSLGGDTAEASRYADMAITDMSDNANKMGTTIDRIQDAYQGFAKQNYTMLDNLKLGYGGTKTEMERLLADAEKLSGVKYDIGNLNDVFEAIHVIQQEMGITGTTALEASTTIQGSISSAKAAWENLLAGLSDDTQDFDALLTNFINSVGTVAENLVPRIGIALSGLSSLVTALVPTILAAVPELANTAVNMVSAFVEGISAALPAIQESGSEIINTLFAGLTSVVGNIVPIAEGLISTFAEGFIKYKQLIFETGLNILTALVSGIAANLGTLIPAAQSAIMSIANTISENLPALLSSGMAILSAIISGITEMLPELIPQAQAAIRNIVNTLADNLPLILQAGIEILTELITGIAGMLPELIPVAVEAVITLVETLIDNVDMLVEAAIAITMALATGLINALPRLLEKAPEIVMKLVRAIIENAPKLLSAAAEIIAQLTIGLVKGFGEILQKVGGWVEANIIQPIKNTVSIFAAIGGELVAGVWRGISDKATWLWNQVSGFFKTLTNRIKSFFGIASPSKLMADMFQFLPEGMAKGILGGANAVTGAIDKINSIVADSLDTDFNAKIRYATEAAAFSVPAVAVASSSGGQLGGGVTIHQYIQSVPQTPYELAQQSVAAWRRARWSV